MFRLILPAMMSLLTLAVSPSVAGAMNQEGHDDWMASLPHALVFMEAAPEARPLSSRRCPVTEKMLAANPYEQIPLPKHGCPVKLKLTIRELAPAASE